ncbi:MAG: DUF6350 family protein [Actinomycetes bacterium]
MLRRVLSISLIQASKGAALTLFPSIFISLLAWSTAGSTSGNTSDPIRGAVWLWLGAHLSPFHLSASSPQGAGFLSVLPLGAIIFPMWAVRRTFTRVVEVSPKPRAARIFYVLFYTLIAIFLAIASATPTVTPMWYYAGLCAGITALVSTFRFNPRPALGILVYLFAIAWGLAAVVLAFSFMSHWRVLHDLSVVIQPGIVGGLLFTALQILYIPNMALATLAYLTGSGFSLGAHTMVTPVTFTLHQIPAIPIFGGLPTGSHPLLMVGVIFWPLLFIAVFFVISRVHPEWKMRNKDLLRTFIMALFFIWEISYFASGELLTPAMKRTGILPERTTSVAAISALLVALIFFYIPTLVRRFVKRG